MTRNKSKMSTKELAESQFNFDAPAISLGIKFDRFTTDYEFDFDQFDDHVEYEPDDPPILISDDINDVECDPRSLVLLANDLHPEKRDSELEEWNQAIEAKPLDQQSDTSDDSQWNNEDENFDQTQEVLFTEPKPLTAKSVKNIDFQIANREFRDDISDAKFGNRAVSAIKLLLLSLNKFDKKELKTMSINEDTNFKLNSMLIDKTQSSIKFINKTALRIQTKLLKSRRYSKFKQDKLSEINFLNNHKAETRKDFLLHYATIAKYIKFSHVEQNSYPGLDMNLQGQHRYVSCHRILNFLNFSTLHKDSPELESVEKLIRNFPSVYDSGRLHYLNHLISEWKIGNLFFNSRFISFFDDKDSRWMNQEFPGINQWLKEFDRVGLN